MAVLKISPAMEDALGEAFSCNGVLLCSQRTTDALVKRGFVERHQHGDSPPFYTLTDEGRRIGREWEARALGIAGKAGDQ